VAAPVPLIADRKLVRKLPDGHIGGLPNTNLGYSLSRRLSLKRSLKERRFSRSEPSQLTDRSTSTASKIIRR
jgi:hypothetical protein